MSQERWLAGGGQRTGEESFLNVVGFQVQISQGETTEFVVRDFILPALDIAVGKIDGAETISGITEPVEHPLSLRRRFPLRLQLRHAPAERAPQILGFAAQRVGVADCVLPTVGGGRRECHASTDDQDAIRWQAIRQIRHRNGKFIAKRLHQRIRLGVTRLPHGQVIDCGRSSAGRFHKYCPMHQLRMSWSSMPFH